MTLTVCGLLRIVTSLGNVDSVPYFEERNGRCVEHEQTLIEVDCTGVEVRRLARAQDSVGIAGHGSGHTVGNWCAVGKSYRDRTVSFHVAIGQSEFGCVRNVENGHTAAIDHTVDGLSIAAGRMNVLDGKNCGHTDVRLGDPFGFQLCDRQLRQSVRPQ